MAQLMESWYRAVWRRFSERVYSASPDDAETEALRNFAESIAARGVRIAVVRDKRVFSGIMGAKIKGTDVFAAVISNGAKPSAVGYIGEAFALECSSRGLATCWLGASYNKSAAGRAVDTEDGETIPVILSVGIPSEEYQERPRKTVEALLGTDSDGFDALPDWKREAIECARRAPSAVNGQPWRFDASGEGIELIRTSSNFGYGKLDCGIAMLHIELGAAHCGVTGEWSEDEERAVFLQKCGIVA